MFRNDAARLKFTPADGLEVLATGSVKVYAQRGRYQLYVASIAPLGQGALELAFKQLKDRLESEGLFNTEAKKPLPAYPMRVALITGRETAALHDMLKVLARFPFVKVSLLPVLVQGEGAAAQICAAIRTVNRADSADILIVARGGGALEDLWAFNEEPVARAIAASNVPVITGIGHEVDVSIADLVADYHAHTPTEAAQVAMARWRNADDAVDALANRLRRALVQQASGAWQRLRAVAGHEMFRRPADMVDQRRLWLDDHQRRLVAALDDRARTARDMLNDAATQFAQNHPRHRVAMAIQQLAQSQVRMTRAIRSTVLVREQRLLAAGLHLRSVSPQATMARGYSITTREDGEVVRTASDLRAGQVIVTSFADGRVKSKVSERPAD